MSLADQHLETLRSGATGGTKGKERQRDDASSAFSKTRVGEGDDVAIDQARLKRARDDEKRRRELTDDEAWQRAKKSKTDVTEEDMGPFLVSTRKHTETDVTQRPTDCRNRLTTIRWLITRIREMFELCTLLYVSLHAMHLLA